MDHNAAIAAVKANPTDGHAWLYLGRIFAAEGNIEKARECFLTAAALDQSLVPAAQEALLSLDHGSDLSSAAPTPPPIPRRRPVQPPPVPATPVSVSPPGSKVPPPHAKPVRRSSMRGCLTWLFLLILLLGGFGAWEGFVSYLWISGLEEFNEGRCQQAIEAFDFIVQYPSLGVLLPQPDYRDQAEQLRRECLAFQEAENKALAGEHAAAMASYLDFWAIHRQSTLTDLVPNRIAALFIHAGASGLATTDVCDRVGLQDTLNAIPDHAELLPQIYYNCGLIYERSEEYDDAIAMFATVRRDFPQHSVVPDATERLARLEVNRAQEAGANEIQQPSRIGPGPAGKAVLVIRNDAPQKVQIILNGPDVIIEDIPECPSCPIFSREPDNCPGKGPQARIVLDPGRYDVVMKSIDVEGVTPYQGSWTFEAASMYEECSYVVEGEVQEDGTGIGTTTSPGQGTQQPANAPAFPTSVPPSVGSQALTHVYQHPSGLFSVRYPNGWEITDYSNEDWMWVSVVGEVAGWEAWVEIGLTDAAGPLSEDELDWFVDGMLDNEVENEPEREILRRTTASDGAILVTAQQFYENVGLVHFEYRFTGRSPYVEVVKLVAPEKTWGEADQLLRAIRESLRITSTTSSSTKVRATATPDTPSWLATAIAESEVGAKPVLLSPDPNFNCFENPGGCVFRWDYYGTLAPNLYFQVQMFPLRQENGRGIHPPTKSLQFKANGETLFEIFSDVCRKDEYCSLEWAVVVVEWDGVDPSRIGRIVAVSEKRPITL